MHRPFVKTILSLCLASAILAAAPLQAQDATTPAAAVSDAGYREPVAILKDIVDAPRPPSLSLSPRRDWAVVSDTPALPPISVVAQPELKLGGMRIHPRYFSASRFSFNRSFELLNVATGQKVKIDGLPRDLNIAALAWSPDQSRVAFTHVSPAEGSNQLWIVDVAARRARQISGVALNSVADQGFEWLPNSRQLLVTLRVSNEVRMPKAGVPTGPVIQQSEQGAGVRQLRTYQDLLTNEEDASLLEYYLTTQLAVVDADTGAQRKLGSAQMYDAISVSPDGRYILTQVLRRPFSYAVPAGAFPRRIVVMDLQGKTVQQIADLPLVEGLPSGNDAVREGVRSVSWRSDAPATLVWAEATDGGDPARQVEVRDVVKMQAAPFNASAREIARLQSRYAGVLWSGPDLALISEFWWKTREQKQWRIAPDRADVKPAIVYQGSSEDSYKSPGAVVTQANAAGKRVIQLSTDGQSIYRIGAGASPEGDRPFLDRQLLKDLSTTRLFRSQAPRYESPVALLDADARQLLVSRESQQEPANIFVVATGNGEATAKPVRQLTSNKNPLPQLSNISKELIRYRRTDGVELSGNLYLPPGFTPGKDKPLPVLMWAYPAEFKSAAAASQVKGSPYRFNSISYWGPLPFLARGYAVLDNPTFPIVGEGKAEPNDTYIKQLVDDAQAAVEELVRRGVGDRNRMAIGGHSYGAFMTANLLAHSRLFKGGIARSGAYNRTLTPFGFQAEERNYWDAKDVYRDMSPFNFAENIKDNLLMIHGIDDNNSGTFPIQSERMFAAVKGLGGNVRLVMLPSESHAYRARESILHMLAEEDAWLDRYVKNAKP